MHLKILVSIKLCLLIGLVSGNCQKLKTCDVTVWKGKKTNPTIEKVAVFNGKDSTNKPIELHTTFRSNYPVWKKKNGVLHLVDSLFVENIYRVTDTVLCREFENMYVVSYRNVIEPGKKLKVKGICEADFTKDFKDRLLQKLIQEGLLTEVPDESIRNAKDLWYIAIMKYQEKYELPVGGLSLETAKHMKLIE